MEVNEGYKKMNKYYTKGK